MQFDAAHIIRRTNERLRHDADAKPRFCHWDDLVSRGGFDGGLKSNALRGENRDVERMGGRARAERDEWIRFQLGKRDASSKQTGKGRRADRNLPNFFDDRLRERRRERNRRCDDRKICRRLVQRRDGLRRGVVADAKMHAGVLFLIPFKYRQE